MYICVYACAYIYVCSRKLEFEIPTKDLKPHTCHSTHSHTHAHMYIHTYIQVDKLTHTTGPRKLEFEVPTPVQSAIRAARIRAEALVDRPQTVMNIFEGFGKDMMKKWKMSPDGVVQMAMQVCNSCVCVYLCVYVCVCVCVPSDCDEYF